jgi:YaiO family outer membrane protein
MTSTPSWPCPARARLGSIFLAPYPLPHPLLDASGGKGWGSFPACALIIVLLVGGVSLVGPAWAAPEEAGAQPSPHELTEKQGPSLPYRQYLKLGYSHFFYSRDNPDERDWLFEAAAASGPYTLIGRIEQLDRFGLDDTYLSGELYSPLWKKAWGYLQGGFGIGSEFTPEWTLGAEAFQGLGPLHPALSPVELSFGYRHLSFEASPIDVLVPGLTVYFPHNIWLTEKLYLVPKTDSKTLSSQLTWRATDRLQVFASGAFGTAGERFTALQDISRVDTISIQAGLNLPLTRRFSLEAVGYYEDRETLYVRSGLSFNLLLHF